MDGQVLFDVDVLRRFPVESVADFGSGFAISFDSRSNHLVCNLVE
jgi:hypothetical protein